MMQMRQLTLMVVHGRPVLHPIFHPICLIYGIKRFELTVAFLRGLRAIILRQFVAFKVLLVPLSGHIVTGHAKDSR